MKHFLLLAIALSLSNCSKSAPELKEEISRLENKLRDTQKAYNQLYDETQTLHAAKTELDHNVKVLRALQRGAKPLYILTLSVRQERNGFDALDIEKHIKDELNEFHFEMPVDQMVYEQSTVGNPLVESFRSGSLLFKLSTSTTVIRVVNKRIDVGT